jgi:hypothetical protein
MLEKNWQEPQRTVLMWARILHSLDPTDVKLGSPNATTRSSEARSITVLFRLHHNAPRASAAIVPAVPSYLRHGLILETPGGSMEGHLVVGIEVDTLDNVDFAVVGPQRALCPERGPDGAAKRDVQDVDDPEAAKVVVVLSSDADLERTRRYCYEWGKTGRQG